MGYPAEQRDHLSTPLCGAKRKNGVLCRAFAGQGTDHLGFGRCKYHGGATRNQRKAALTAQTKQRMIALSVPVEDAEPNAVLLSELRNQSGHVAWLNAELQQIEDDGQLGSDRSRIVLDRLDNERDRLHRLAAECARSGVAQEAIRAQQESVTAMVKVMIEAMKMAGISDDYVKAFGIATRILFATGQIREVGAGDPRLDPELAASERKRLDELLEKIAEKDRRRVEKAAQKLAGLVPAAEMGMAVIDAPARDVSHPRTTRPRPRPSR